MPPTGLPLWGKLNFLNNNGILDTLIGLGGLPYWVSPSGSDSGFGTFDSPKLTLGGAYPLLRAGKHDFIILLGDPTSTALCTIRQDSAFTWNKAATHLIGQSATLLFGQRARIAPTGTDTAFTPFFTVSASGCMFINVEWFHGFNTGTTAQICMPITGSRNYFKNCQIAGMGDTTSAGDAGSRSLVVGSAGAGENFFEDCVIGLDTVARGAANASLELTGGTPRNVFRRCLFPFVTSAASPLGILGTGASCIDRENYFDDCTFANAIKSGSTAMTVLASLTNASPGGALIFKKCMSMGITKFGDTNALANSYIDMAAVSAAAGGLGVNPS